VRLASFLVLLAASSGALAEPLMVRNGRLFIAASVNGVPTEALLDSGAEATLVDPELAGRAKLPAGQATVIKGSGGQQQARIVPDVAVQAMGITLHPEAVVVLDLTDLSQRLIKHPTQAIVGRELFDAARLRVDIPGGTIERVSPDVTPPGRRLPLTAHAGIESLRVEVNGVAANADFDLGNGSDVMISRAMARKLGLKVTGRKSGGGIGGEIMRDTVVLGRLHVGGAIFRNVPATIDDQPSANDLNVGTSILKNFLITTDFKQRAVWLEPVGSIGDVAAGAERG
jgi:predicted aspartyl protease